MEIWPMKYIWIAIFACSIATSCQNKTSEKKPSTVEEDRIIPSFTFDTSSVDFSVSDSLGFSIAFHKHPDSSRYHFMRFHKPDSIRNLTSILPTMASLWSAASAKIDIRLTSVNIGYPLEYDDVLTHHIEAFTSSDLWQANGPHDERVNYSLVSQIMFAHNIFPLHELMTDFGYEITGFSIEKVGFVQPEKLFELGFDKSLNIPVPYMVWIEVAQTR